MNHELFLFTVGLCVPDINTSTSIPDATGIPVSTGNFDNSPVLGCGVLAAVGCGLHNSINDAITNMVRHQKKIEPSMESKAKYDKVYKVYACLQIYCFICI